MASESKFDWKPLGAVPPTSLQVARLEAHAGASLAGAVGRALAAPADDYSHVSLRWRPDEGLLEGARVERSRPVRALFRPARSELLMRGDEGDAIGSLALEGRTVGEARAWLAAALTALSPEPGDPPVDLVAPGVGSPDLEIGKPGLGALEIAAWLSNAAGLLEEIRTAAGPSASPICCWPHHFDIATLISVATDDGGAAVKTVGTGMAPMGGGYDSWYWYVTPWPSPGPEALPPLQGPGAWHTAGWTGVVLTGEELLATDDVLRKAVVQKFLDVSIEAAIASLG
jgi:hypothetical protein